MSCTVCHHITGHAADCAHGIAERAADQDDLRARVEALENKVDRLTDRIVDYAHLKKLYAESRDYVATLVRERDDLVEANRRTADENNHLDAAVEKLRECLVKIHSSLTTWARLPELKARWEELLHAEKAAAQVLAEVAGAEELR